MISNKFLSAGILIIMVASTTAGAMDTVSVSGAVEAEYGASRNYAGDRESGFALATVELGIDAKLNDNIDGHIYRKKAQC